MSSATYLSNRAGDGKVTLPRVVTSEWIKFRSLRSSWITLAVAAALTIGFGALFCWATMNRWDHLPADERAAFTPAEHSLRGFYLAQMAIGVLGVLVVTGEYSTGMIRASLSAVPKRLPVLWAKALVFGAVTWVVATVSCLVAFFVGQSILAGKHLDTTLSAPGVTRVVLGMGLYLTAIGLLAVALGTLIRNTAGGIASVFGVLLVLPVLCEALPSSWQQNISPYLPGTAGQALTHITQAPHEMAPWAGFGLLCGYVAIALVAAAAVLKRRDA
ncbi:MULTISPECIES: ABC transporter permease [Kitasatospora]|uniref:ABC transporter permease n=1 Tax=Kitasatospora TaxID=2063 RepID=UPI000C70AB4E|nr:ABC transporter permease subunit [Kitasatospora sp. GP30]MDH6138953.1 ABC-2 type transport system permease protein [Kitasatospora sp. GP30]